MARQNAVKMLADVAQTRTDTAARELGALTVQGKQLEEKLALLLQYRDDYQARFREAIKSGLDKAGWDNFHGFMDKLDAAIEQQKLAIAQFDTRVSAGQDKWRHERRRLESFDALTRRYELSEARVIASREQREQDEHAAKAHVARRARADHD